MAGSRRAQDIDQWRPEEHAPGHGERGPPTEQPRGRIDDARPSNQARARPFARPQPEPRAHASPQSRSIQARASSDLEKGTQRGQGCARSSTAPPSSRDHTAREAPPQPLAVPQERAQTLPTPPKPQPATLDFTRPPPGVPPSASTQGSHAATPLRSRTAIPTLYPTGRFLHTPVVVPSSFTFG
ncbi:hypothetical protein ACEQ8H_006483 [Pleosporales sp. CAS-2024a]